MNPNAREFVFNPTATTWTPGASATTISPPKPPVPPAVIEKSGLFLLYVFI